MRTPFAVALLAVLTALPVIAGAHPDHEPRDDRAIVDKREADQRRHERSDDGSRFYTTRDGRALELPTDEDSFVFAVFGDRTGGPAEGVKVLAEAVADVNLIEPDLVMTVGDLIEGYSDDGPWLAQMREYKAIMDELHCPWFPVAGNHDIYWRGANTPPGEHEKNYEIHFGPLWYSFEHRDCAFIALYSDEGDPNTGEKTFRKPASQTMSPEQVAFLKDSLDRYADARHIFIFLHHPRWIGGNYGDDWKRIHKMLVDAGNVSAVFAGHIHEMRHDILDNDGNIVDGAQPLPGRTIEYVTLATVGGHQAGVAPAAGYLHEFHLVTVRNDQIALSAIPVGEVMDVRALTGEVSRDIWSMRNWSPTITQGPTLAEDGAAQGTVRIALPNPLDRPLDYTVALRSDDSRWTFTPDHTHGNIPPGATKYLNLGAHRIPSTLDHTFRKPQLVVDLDYLGKGIRVPMPTRSFDVPLNLELAEPSATDGVARFTGDSAMAIPSRSLSIEGPLTLECWFNADRFDDRTGLITKTENSAFGIFVSNGKPEFSIFLDDAYLTADGGAVRLQPGRWYHIAAVYDGNEARLYLDGVRIGAATRKGSLKPNNLPLIIGADVDSEGKPTSHFTGFIDSVHLSNTPRYTGAKFTPTRRPTADDNTVALLNMDGIIGLWAWDESGNANHAEALNGASIVQTDN